MLTANSTREMNQSARAAQKYLCEQGIEMPHAKVLDLVARMVGSPHYLAAQASLPQTGLKHPAPVQTCAELKTALLALSAEQRLPLLEELQPVAAAKSVIEDLCRILVNPDVDASLHREGIADAAYAALAMASAFVSDEVLGQFAPDVLREAYDDLPVSCEPEDFVAGHGGWGLTEDEFRAVSRLAPLLVKSSRTGPDRDVNSVDANRLFAQFELALGRSPVIVKDYIRSFGLSQALLKLNGEYGANLSLGTHVVFSVSEKGYWCNNFGWTPSKVAASGFAAPLPGASDTVLCDGGARLVPFKDAVNFPDEHTDSAALNQVPNLVTSTQACEVSAENVARVCAQFEMSTSCPAAYARQSIDERGLEGAMAYLNKKHEIALSLGPMIVASASEDGFFCAGFGWTTSKMAATGYSAQLPGAKAEMVGCSDARYVTFVGAVDFSLDGPCNSGDTEVMGEPVKTSADWDKRYQELWETLSAKAREGMTQAGLVLAEKGYRTEIVDRGDLELGLDLNVWAQETPGLQESPAATYQFVLIEGSVNGFHGAAISGEVLDSKDTLLANLGPVVGASGFATEAKYFDDPSNAWFDADSIAAMLLVACERSACYK